MKETGPHCFPGSKRLKTGKEFEVLRKKGRLYKTPHFLVYVLKNTAGVCRLGLTVSRKVGNSPERNRVKRLLREFFRRQLQVACRDRDFSIVARPGASLLSFDQVVEELGGLKRFGNSRG